MVSDSEEEDLDEEEEPEDEDDDEVEEIAQSSGVNPIPIILNPNVRPMYGNPNIRPMYANGANGGVRPIYNVNNSTNPMNVVRPIIINGVQVGTYTRPVNPMNMRPGAPPRPFMRPVNPAVRPVNPVQPSSSAAETAAAPKRKIEDSEEGKKKSRWGSEEEK